MVKKDLKHWNLVVESEHFECCSQGFEVDEAKQKSCLFFNLNMDKLQLTGQNLGRVFNFRSGHLLATQFWCSH